VGQNNQEQMCRNCYTSLSRDSVPPTRKPYSGDYFQHAQDNALASRLLSALDSAVATLCGRAAAHCEEAV